MQCPLCSFEFEPRSGCSTSCPFGSGCNLVCCPNCGYQGVDPERSRLAGWVQRAISRFTGPKPVHATGPAGDGGRIALSRLDLGIDATVVDLSAMSPARALRLGAFGLSTGAHVRLVQRRPVPVLRIGETDLGLESAVLDEIQVVPGRRETDEPSGRAHAH